MKTVATPPAPRRPGPATPLPAPGRRSAPEADCLADSAGGLTFDLADRGRLLGAHLLLRRRSSEEEVRLPLTPAGTGRLRAALPSSMDLAEGRWDVFAEPAGGRPVRLLPGLNDLRALVDRDPEGASRVAVRIPYPTKFGNLSVRSWQRSPHAEAGEIRVDPGLSTVHGRLYGAELGPGARVEARSEGGEGRGRVHRFEAGGKGHAFELALPHPELASQGPGDWSLWLRPAGASGPEVRIAQLLDDLHDRHAICTYPAAESGGLRVGPAYTEDNDLAMCVREAAEA
ncbi:hypothetical protein AB0J21_24510 [Streptomyces sp. NPDC049954]|uniref:hypothetical protein n=1 Tax=Streptomyces sp. NPDC049954 TaxID=3155779 RepID=UPI00341BCBD0